MQRARGAYFVNRYGTFWKEENFNFPEHQNFLKFIKKSLRKSKNWDFFFENFHFPPKSWKISFFSKKSKKIEKSRKIMILENFQIFEKNEKFRNFSYFFDFLNDFFMDFKKNWCSGKLKFSSFQKVSYLFTEYAPLASSLHGCFWKTHFLLAKYAIPSSPLVTSLFY